MNPFDERDELAGKLAVYISNESYIEVYGNGEDEKWNTIKDLAEEIMNAGWRKEGA